MLHFARCQEATERELVKPFLAAHSRPQWILCELLRFAAIFTTNRTTNIVRVLVFVVVFVCL